jgi:hypothetical protein
LPQACGDEPGREHAVQQIATSFAPNCPYFVCSDSLLALNTQTKAAAGPLAR